MKKILKATSVVLLLAIMLSACVSCKGKLKAKDIAEMYANSAPTMVVSRTVQTTGDITLTSTYSLQTGTVGGKAAAIYEENYQRMRSVESGGESTTIYDYIEEVHNLFQYVEGKGTRQLHPDTHLVIKDWDINGKTFVIEQGSFALALKNKYVKNQNYDAATKTYTAKVPAKHTAAVFGSAIPVDVQIAIVNNGAEIIAVNIEYDLPAEGNVQPTHVVIHIEYTYDNERINLD